MNAKQQFDALSDKLPLTQHDVAALGFRPAGHGGSYKLEWESTDYHHYLQVWSSGKVWRYKMYLACKEASSALVGVDTGIVYTYEDLRELVNDVKGTSNV